MKGNTSIWYLSRCENPRCKNPYHCVPVHAVIDTKELPDKCECGGRLTWEAGVHQHNIESIKRKSKINKVNVIVWAVSILLVLAITGAIITPYVLAHREYSDEEMAAAVKETAGRSIDDILCSTALTDRDHYCNSCDGGITPRSILPICSEQKVLAHYADAGRRDTRCN